MTVRDYFNSKYAKNAPEYLVGVLRTIDKLPAESDEDDVLELTEEQILKSVQEK